MEAAQTLQERSSGVGAESETDPNREIHDDEDEDVNLETGKIVRVMTITICDMTHILFTLHRYKIKLVTVIQ